MAGSSSVINLGDLSKPATVLIEKISNAVGVLYEPRRIRKKAEAEGEAEKIKCLASIELTKIQQRGIDRLAYQEGRKQENIENITSQAISTLNDKANVSELNEDWIAYFFKNCEDVSDNDMQSIWANMLSGEASNPGTFSKRSIAFIASMDKQEAEQFTAFCQFLITEDNQYVPLVFNLHDEIYINAGLDYASISHLDAIGLIKFQSVASYTLSWSADEPYCKFNYFNKELRIDRPDGVKYDLPVGMALLTQVGRELVPICGALESEEFYNYILMKMFETGVPLYCEI